MDKKTNNLIRHAIRVRKNSYSPYSKYSVGAALLTKSGKIFTGCNVENVSYGECICAEKSAVLKAVSEGYKNFTTIVVATRNGASPCGSCRQVLQEFSPNIQVIVVDENKKTKEFYLSDLLPHTKAPDLKK